MSNSGICPCTTQVKHYLQKMQTKDLLNLLKCRRHALQFRYLSFHLTSHIFQAHTKNAKEGTSIGSKVASEGKGNWTGADTGGSGERASIFVSG